MSLINLTRREGFSYLSGFASVICIGGTANLAASQLQDFSAYASLGDDQRLASDWTRIGGDLAVGVRAVKARMSNLPPR